jgi:hypothetical protein
MNLSTADLRNYRTEFDETWWSYRYMILVGPKVFSLLNFYRPYFMPCMAAIVKMADILKILKTQNCFSKVTYHYVKCYDYRTEFDETWWSYRYMILVGPKVFSFVVKGVKVIF